MSSLSDYADALREAGCLVCGQAPQLHHVTGGSIKDRGLLKSKNSKNSDWLQIPLCINHHTGKDGIHSIGVRTWEERYGEQSYFIDRLCEVTGLNLWELALDDKAKYNSD